MFSLRSSLVLGMLLIPCFSLSSEPNSSQVSSQEESDSSKATQKSVTLQRVTPGEIATKRLRKPAPLQRLVFSARRGFSLRMISNEEVTAELRNGAGRTLARANYILEAGDWKLHPRNLQPGVYTVLLRTGAQLRSMRLKIDDVDRGHGKPEWVLEKAPADSAEIVEPQSGLDLVLDPACPT
jgi:hypothetical protein